jgi:hypothetical protein
MKATGAVLAGSVLSGILASACCPVPEFSYDSNETDPATIAETLQKAGFDVRLLPWEFANASFKACSKPLYVCCEGCLRYLQANREKVLALRGLAARS